jgi:hypothetical protein
VVLVEAHVFNITYMRNKEMISTNLTPYIAKSFTSSQKSVIQASATKEFQNFLPKQYIFDLKAIVLT